MTSEIISRIQFAFSATLHYLYPQINIGIGVFLIVLQLMYIFTKNDKINFLTAFWTKIFTLFYILGAITGILLELEFATNWAIYSKYIHDIFGDILEGEGVFSVITVLISLFILNKYSNKISPKFKLSLFVIVTSAISLSAFLITIANSWQQTPSGYEIISNGNNLKAHIVDKWSMIFNPSALTRICHVFNGAFISSFIFVLSVHAYFILKSKFIEESKFAIKYALIFTFIVSISSFFTGHHSANLVSKYQPSKFASIEAHLETSTNVDFYLFGWIDNQNHKVNGVKIENGISYFLTSNTNSIYPGLNSFNKSDLPSQLNFAFQSYHIMIYCAFVIFIFTLFLIYRYFRQDLFNNLTILKITSCFFIIPIFANTFGWYTAEIGRQPWLIYGLLRTKDALSEHLSQERVLFFVVLFLLLYLIQFALFLKYLMKIIRKQLI